nr:MAG TPA: hypothetical protein [Caudoviricetes sp.]
MCSILPPNYTLFSLFFQHFYNKKLHILSMSFSFI